MNHHYNNYKSRGGGNTRGGGHHQRGTGGPQNNNTRSQHQEYADKKYVGQVEEPQTYSRGPQSNASATSNKQNQYYQEDE